MTQTKSTKKALFMSMLSLLLCVAMLIGSTFAWFTDSVTGGRNKITAGNLDVELWHNSASVKTDTEVNGDTKLFLDADGNSILWEPGVIAYENFTVKNVGTLALKYKLAMNVWGNNTVKVGEEEKSLADVIKVAAIEGGTFAGGRTEAQALDFDKTVTDFTAERELLLPGKSEQFALVLYWEPGDKDNDYNLNNGKESNDGEPLWIDLGVNLQATQTPYEKDSFDETYDDGIELPELLNKVFTSKVDEPSEGYYHVGDDIISVDAPADLIDSDDIEELYLVVETTDRTKTSHDLDISLLDEHHEKVPNADETMYKVNIKLAPNLKDVVVTHITEPMTEGGDANHEGFVYNAETGLLNIYTKNFSPFKITWTIPYTITYYTNTELKCGTDSFDPSVTEPLPTSVYKSEALTDFMDYVAANSANYHAALLSKYIRYSTSTGLPEYQLDLTKADWFYADKDFRTPISDADIDKTPGANTKVYVRWSSGLFIYGDFTVDLGDNMVTITPDQKEYTVTLHKHPNQYRWRGPGFDSASLGGYAIQQDGQLKFMGVPSGTKYQMVIEKYDDTTETWQPYLTASNISNWLFGDTSTAYTFKSGKFRIAHYQYEVPLNNGKIAYYDYGYSNFTPSDTAAITHISDYTFNISVTLDTK